MFLSLLFCVLMITFALFSCKKDRDTLPETIRKLNPTFTITYSNGTCLAIDKTHSLIYINMDGIHRVFPASKIESYGFLYKKKNNAFSRGVAGTVLFGPVGGAIGSFTSSSSNIICGYYINIKGISNSIKKNTDMDYALVAKDVIYQLDMLTNAIYNSN